jgi:hypothetical protein
MFAIGGSVFPTQTGVIARRESAEAISAAGTRQEIASLRSQ